MLTVKAMSRIWAWQKMARKESNGQIRICLFEINQERFNKENH